MIRATVLRALVLTAAFAAGLTPVTCLGESSDRLPAKATKELPRELLSLLRQKKMPKHSPILVRLFKEEAELEVWKQDTTGRFQILKIYPICRWSGDLGPKVHEGDRQAPEGFYTITPELMNPNSNYHLAINTGFPNTFDKANDRDGAFLMIHGDCSSRGCYAMTDEQIAEIYSLGRESFFGGQKSFQLQAYPFKMTPINMARHRNNPNMPFWKMIKEGYDHFEVTRQEPKVDFCEKKYVFDAVKAPNATRDLVFDASAKSPAYVIPDELADAVREKQQQDAAETAKLISRGTPVARANPGIDGGMNKVFAAKLPDGSTGLSAGGDGQGLSLLSLSRAPGPIPSHVNPPRMPTLTPQEEPVVAVSSSTATRVAAATPTAQQPKQSEQSEGFFSSLARKVGIGGSDAPASAPPPP